MLTADETTYPHLLQVSSQVLALGNDGNIVELPLLLGQQLEPPAHGALDDLTKISVFIGKSPTLNYIFSGICDLE